jgi:hypothetical protein
MKKRFWLGTVGWKDSSEETGVKIISKWVLEGSIGRC